MVEREPQIPHISSEGVQPVHSDEPAMEAVNDFLQANEAFFDTVEQLWGTLTDAKEAFCDASAIPRRIVGYEMVGGERVITFQRPKSSNPQEWPAGTISFDPFPVIRGYADRANRRVNVIDDRLRKFAPVTFNVVEVHSLIDLYFEQSAREEAPDAVQQGGDIELYQEAQHELGMAYDAAATIQRLGVHKIDILLEDPERVMPFFAQIGNIAVARQSGETQYPGLLETIAADIGQARVYSKKSVLQSAIQRVLQSQSAASETAEADPQAAIDSRRAALALRKSVRHLLEPFEDADRILQPDGPSAEK